MAEAQVRSAGTRIGQPFNPFRTFTGIFIPEGMVRSPLIYRDTAVSDLRRLGVRSVVEHDWFNPIQDLILTERGPAWPSLASGPLVF